MDDEYCGEQQKEDGAMDVLLLYSFSIFVEIVE